MKEELQDKLVEILSAIQTATGQAKDFTLSQLPDVAQSYIAFGRIWSPAAMVLCLIVFVAIWYGILRYARETFDEGFVVFLGGVVSILPALGVLMYLKSTLLVWFAPKVWLLTEIARMVK